MERLERGYHSAELKSLVISLMATQGVSDYELAVEMAISILGDSRAFDLGEDQHE